MYAIDWQPRARRQIAKIGERAARLQIVAAIDELARFPAVPGLEPLRNHRYGWRLRAGRFRVLLDVDSRRRLVTVQEIRKRDERTY
jgi:mRNA interferase RelE/StbE